MLFPFPKDFLFGAASSAVQLESACEEGGKGEDIQRYTSKHRPEQIKGDPNDAADFYHRYPEDIQQMKELGLKTFRFSISWSRIYPNGPDEVNKQGLAYYEDMVKRMLDAGIAPMFDLWHCDLPMWVADRGGLVNPEFIDWFTSYAKTVFEVLGDKVAFWSTVNEPHVNCMTAYEQALYPPYVADIGKALLACHHMIIAHYRTARLYKQMGYKGQIGAVIYLPICYAANAGKPEDLAAAERCQAFHCGWWLDTMQKGHYPKAALEYPYVRDNMPEGYQQQLEREFVPADFVAINYYNAGYIQYEPDGKLDCKWVQNERLPSNNGFPARLYPQGLYDALMYIKNNYPGKDIYITENGITEKKPKVSMDDDLNDDFRVDFMREHMRSISRAIQAGAPVKGYYPWTLIDTHEGGGFDSTFGLIQVNFETKERRPRKSWYYYQQVIKNGFVD